MQLRQLRCLRKIRIERNVLLRERGCGVNGDVLLDWMTQTELSATTNYADELGGQYSNNMKGAPVSPAPPSASRPRFRIHTIVKPNQHNIQSEESIIRYKHCKKKDGGTGVMPHGR